MHGLHPVFHATRRIRERDGRKNRRDKDWIHRSQTGIGFCLLHQSMGSANLLPPFSSPPVTFTACLSGALAILFPISVIDFSFSLICCPPSVLLSRCFDLWSSCDIWFSAIFTGLLLLILSAPSYSCVKDAVASDVTEWRRVKKGKDWRRRWRERQDTQSVPLHRIRCLWWQLLNPQAVADWILVCENKRVEKIPGWRKRKKRKRCVSVPSPESFFFRLTDRLPLLDFRLRLQEGGKVEWSYCCLIPKSRRRERNGILEESKVSQASKCDLPPNQGTLCRPHVLVSPGFAERLLESLKMFSKLHAAGHLLLLHLFSIMCSPKSAQVLKHEQIFQYMCETKFLDEKFLQPCWKDANTRCYQVPDSPCQRVCRQDACLYFHFRELTDANFTSKYPATSRIVWVANSSQIPCHSHVFGSGDESQNAMHFPQNIRFQFISSMDLQGITS